MVRHIEVVKRMCGTTISVEIKELLEFVYAISSQLALSGNPVELAYRFKTLMKQPFFFYKKMSMQVEWRS